jgi:hypothetical protein
MVTVGASQILGSLGVRRDSGLVCACQAAPGATLAWATGVGLVVTPVGVWPVEPGHELAVGGPCRVELVVAF